MAVHPRQRRRLITMRERTLMNELQQLLGDSYKEGMTVEEINNALQGRKFADLSTGAYVDKNKYDADIKAKDALIQDKAKALAEKMTADEKAQQAQLEKDALIESLQKQIKDGQINSSKSSAESIMAESKNILGIKDNDNAYEGFITSIASDNVENTKTLAKYINQLVKDSYEKGKKDASHDNLGKFSKDISTGGSKDGGDVNNYGKQLAAASKMNQNDPNLYFK